MKLTSFIMVGLATAELTALDRLTRVNDLLSDWVENNVDSWKR